MHIASCIATDTYTTADLLLSIPCLQLFSCGSSHRRTVETAGYAANNKNEGYQNKNAASTPKFNFFNPHFFSPYSDPLLLETGLLQINENLLPNCSRGVFYCACFKTDLFMAAQVMQAIAN